LAPAAFNPHGSQDNPERKLIGEINKGESSQALLAYAEKEKFLLRFNDFTALDPAKEERDKDKDQQTGKN
jgi:hypothetical protein